jgi:hypothetical protein
VEELRRDLAPDLAGDLVARVGARRRVDLTLVGAPPGLVEVFRAVDFFRPVPFRLCPGLFLEPLDAAPIRAPDNAPVSAPASARLKTPPVFLSARFALSAAAALVDLLFLFTISYSQGRNSPAFRR